MNVLSCDERVVLHQAGKTCFAVLALTLNDSQAQLTKARPDVGLMKPRSVRSNVVFPAPFGPSNPKISPDPTAYIAIFKGTQ